MGGLQENGVRPAYDPELVLTEDRQHHPVPNTYESLQKLRRDEPQNDPVIASDSTIVERAETISGPNGDIDLAILESSSRSSQETLRPGILFFHAGGRIQGNPQVGLTAVSEMIKDVDAVLVSPSYRLAPEHTGEEQVTDCYTTLLWVGSHMEELGIDPAHLMIAGVSAGGGLAVGTALMARDKGGPRLCGQLLACPMLDDRCDSLSSKQFDLDTRGYYTQFGRYAWGCVLGDLAGKSQGVSEYVAPGRAKDLAGLPPAYIDVGSSEPFRDEDVALAHALWESGVQADLHVWSGGNHGFDIFEPPSWLGGEAKKARTAWLLRTLTR